MNGSLVSLFFVFFSGARVVCANRVTLSKMSNASHPGFIKAPFEKYISDICNDDTSIRNMGDAGWCIWCQNGDTQCYAWHNDKVEKSVPTNTMKDGDSFVFRIDFPRRVCEVSHNGRSLGVVFENVCSELQPAISNFSLNLY